MQIDTEEKAKIAALCAIATALLCTDHIWLGIGCFALLLPWADLGRVAVWVLDPAIRARRAERALEPVEDTTQLAIGRTPVPD